MPGVEQIDGTGMSETVDRIDNFEPFVGQGHGEVFLTDSIDAMACQFLPLLIDKEAVLI